MPSVFWLVLSPGVCSLSASCLDKSLSVLACVHVAHAAIDGENVRNPTQARSRVYTTSHDLAMAESTLEQSSNRNSPALFLLDQVSKIRV